MEQLPREASSCGAIGVTYDGHEPLLLARMLPLVDYVEVTLEAIAKHHDGFARLDEEVISELKVIENDVNIVLHGVGLSIGSHDGWSPRAIT